MKVVFFGSPDFAVASLEALLSSKHEVVGVVTQPDRPAGRGLKLEAPAVKKAVAGKAIPLIQPEKVNSQETYDFLDRLSPDILCVVAYGGFLGKKLLTGRRFPPVNVHPSLLPDLRGAAPMQWALIRGYQETGVTTQFMVKEMDAGDVLLQAKSEIGPNETAKDLHDRLRLVGGELLVRTLDLLDQGTLRPRPQNPDNATFAPLLTKEQGLIRWASSSAKTIHNMTRGLYPWPGAFTLLNKKRVKLLRSKVAPAVQSSGRPGCLEFRHGQLFVPCAEGVLEILELQLEGKRAMLPTEFANGIKGMSFAGETPCFEVENV